MFSHINWALEHLGNNTYITAQGIIHFVCMQKLCVSGGKKYEFFGNCVHVVNKTICPQKDIYTEPIKTCIPFLFTRECLIQEGCHLLIFRFSSSPYTLLRPPCLLILAKGVKSPILFLYIKDRGQYLSCVLHTLVVVWNDAIALYSCFEAMGRKDTIVLHFYFEVSFYKLQIL